MKTYQLYVSNPAGIQEFVTVTDSGSYHDLDAVIWDERVDGPFPEEALAYVGTLSRTEESLVHAPELETAYIEYITGQELLYVQRTRAPQYPSMGDQLDAMYKARQGYPDALKAIDAQIAAVKAANPKPISLDEKLTLWSKIKQLFGY